MKLIIEAQKGFWTFHIGFFFIENSKEAQGYTNRCKDGQYVTFLDYDREFLKDVVANKDFLEKKFGIFFDFLIQTKKGFHLISLDKISYNILREILQDSHCDPLFARVPFETALRSSTLRISKKDGNIPKLLMQFKRKEDSGFELSEAHFLFLRKAFKISRPLGQFDDFKALEVVNYWTKGR